MEVLRNTKWGLILCSIIIVSTGFAAEKGNFKIPSLKGYNFDIKWNDDWDEDGKVDTIIKNYKNSEGDSISKAYKKGTNRIWAWSLNTANDNNSNIVKNYVIADTNDDGNFDTQYSLDEDVPLPSWVEK